MKHLRANWHRHLALWGTLVAAASVPLTAAVVHHERGGYRPGPLPPPIRIEGAPLPASWSLARWIVRVHNQGASNSCVGQTAATIEEITQYEAGRRPVAFSSGYVWNQLNGGIDQGISYPAAFDLLHARGDARLADFQPDGATDPFVLPPAWVTPEAYRHHIRAYASISPWDSYTMRAEIRAGRPLAVAIPVTDGYYNQFGVRTMPVIDAQSGRFWFWHSMTAIGYRPEGLVILNSWGPAWGLHGMAVLTWRFLGNVGAAVVMSTPIAPPYHRPVYRFPYALWNAYAAGHRWPPNRYISPRWHGRWSWAASIWSRNRRYMLLRGAMDGGRWFGPTRGRTHGFSRTRFAGGSIYTWPSLHASRVVPAAHRTGRARMPQPHARSRA